MKTRDIDIRNQLHKDLEAEFHGDPSTLILDELGLCQGDARIDVAVINGAIHGYEIKSDSDTLERLPCQMEIYNKVFDTVTIVVGECHSEKATDLLPDWWGIKQVELLSGDICLVEKREPQLNPEIDPYSLAQLLWKDEAVELLRMYELEKGFLSKPRKFLWKRIAENIPLLEIQSFIRQRLKNRRNWRAD